MTVEPRPKRYPPPEFPPRRQALFARTPPAIFPPILGFLALALAVRLALADTWLDAIDELSVLLSWQRHIV